MPLLSAAMAVGEYHAAETATISTVNYRRAVTFLGRAANVGTIFVRSVRLIIQQHVQSVDGVLLAFILHVAVLRLIALRGGHRAE